jgi:PPP family 3-phenylpropionic acid transporter
VPSWLQSLQDQISQCFASGQNDLGRNFSVRGRLIFFYVAIFTFIGIYLPFWPVWLKAQGLSVEALGLVLAAGTWIRIAANPIAGHFADARADRRLPILVLTATSAFIFLAFSIAQGFWQLLIVAVVFGAVWSPVMSLHENLTLLTVYEQKLDYGRIRLWGSLTFMAVSILAGLLLKDRTESLIFVMLVAALAFQWAAAVMLPDIKPLKLTEATPTVNETSPSSRETPRGPFGRLIRDKLFLLFLVSVGASQASHGMIYAFGTLHWRAIGLGDNLIGILWAQGVIAEIVLFVFGQTLLRRVGAANLMLLGAALGVVRWGLTAFIGNFWGLMAVQSLHAFTFGASHLGAVHFLIRAIRPQDSASAQSLLAAVSGGLGLGLTMAVSGPLYANLGGHAFLVMSLLSLGGAGGILALAGRWRGGALGPEPGHQDEVRL